MAHRRRAPGENWGIAQLLACTLQGMLHGFDPKDSLGPRGFSLPLVEVLYERPERGIKRNVEMLPGLAPLQGEVRPQQIEVRPGKPSVLVFPQPGAQEKFRQVRRILAVVGELLPPDLNDDLLVLPVGVLALLHRIERDHSIIDSYLEYLPQEHRECVERPGGPSGYRREHCVDIADADFANPLVRPQGPAF